VNNKIRKKPRICSFLQFKPREKSPLCSKLQRFRGKMGCTAKTVVQIHEQTGETAKANVRRQRQGRKLRDCLYEKGKS